MVALGTHLSHRGDTHGGIPPGTLRGGGGKTGHCRSVSLGAQVYRTSYPDRRPLVGDKKSLQVSSVDLSATSATPPLNNTLLLVARAGGFLFIKVLFQASFQEWTFCGIMEAMKGLVATITLLSFVSVAVFGFMGMTREGGHMTASGTCVASTAQHATCPQDTSSVQFAVFHLTAYKGFSLAAFGESLMSQLLLVCALAFLAVVLAFPSQLHMLSSRVAHYRHQLKDPSFLSHTRALVRWIALHENSPATL